MTRRVPALALVVALALSLVVAVARPASAGDALCVAQYTVQSKWDGGFTAQVRLRNTSGKALTSWRAAFSFRDGQTISQAWNAEVVTASGRAKVRHLSYNTYLAKGAWVEFGFNGTWSDGNRRPIDFRLNGERCVLRNWTATVTGGTASSGPTASSGSGSGVGTTTTVTQSSSKFFTSADTQAYAAFSSASGTQRKLLAKIAKTPTARWIGDWYTASQAKAETRTYTRAAKRAGRTGVMVIYAIPGRDCGSYSAGGLTATGYKKWIDAVADGIVGKPWIVLEPDAIAQMGDCSGQGNRAGLLRYAAKVLTQHGGKVYLDAGHSNWRSVSDTVSRLKEVGFRYAVGFSLNTSNYNTTKAERAYGQAISKKLGGKPFVIDTSRNGNGSNGEWCNPSGRALGAKPGLVKDSSNLKALLWIKAPGESDGTCNGGPAAGQWWQKGALALARNASW
ncbi:glycoside hydrolase family 6 protein [Demequina sp. NBRC 110054]|uniref:glycoside hydrolase family 6 protein n=1 Tax=Demequina sp. NBRC 110054 TaxID=1570343 RepID=UPI000A014FCA|nr:glycoside hydrolase family 6 protein [Demequina sp. NBRC 110054]